MIKAPDIVRQLNESDIYRDYEKAFSQATHLPLALRPEVLWQPALHGQKNENPFCAIMAESSRSCAACLQVQQEMNDGALSETKSVTCFAGLCDTSVPLIVAGNTIGFLQTGQVALRRPTQLAFSRIARQLLKWGTQVDLNKLEDAYFHSLTLARPQYEAMLRLLEIFAQHLSLVANQILVQTEHAEPPLITKAKSIIQENQEEELSLDHMAKALNVSTFYFCKMFKKATGLTFTDYLARTRVEKAKNVLLNPQVRVSEAAFAAGFASITHFNRIFKRVAGKSPTEYRQTLFSKQN